VKPFVQHAARQDILDQYRYFLDVDSAELANRFLSAVNEAIDKIARNPDAGVPRKFVNPLLTGLRCRGITGFDEMRICYMTGRDTVTIIRVLHTRRDLGAIFAEQGVDRPEED